MIRRDRETGMPRGNLKISIVVREHPVFERRNKDLRCQVEIGEEAMTNGGEIRVATFDGLRPLRIPKGTQSGDEFRLRGLGMPDIGGGQRGDIVVEVASAGMRA
jgi:molecular chaperone DnaJ